jgi:hypothetical protein
MRGVHGQKAPRGASIDAYCKCLWQALRSTGHERLRLAQRVKIDEMKSKRILVRNPSG